jgi:hypothetical protein
MLMAQRLQRAGLAFLEVRARHRNGKAEIDEAVVETVEQQEALTAWCGANDLPVRIARVATPDELAEYQRWQENV